MQTEAEAKSISAAERYVKYVPVRLFLILLCSCEQQAAACQRVVVTSHMSSSSLLTAGAMGYR